MAATNASPVRFHTPERANATIAGGKKRRHVDVQRTGVDPPMNTALGRRQKASCDRDERDGEDDSEKWKRNAHAHHADRDDKSNQPGNGVADPGTEREPAGGQDRRTRKHCRE
jgi:hypothetical protein